MNTILFKKIADQMLKTHYGITINDTHFTVDTVVQREIAYHARPFEALNEYAEDFDLDRIDIPNLMSTKKPLTLADEIAAMIAIQGMQESGEDPLTCQCGCRTDFKLLSNGRQFHTCTNPDCRNEFISEDEKSVCHH